MVGEVPIPTPAARQVLIMLRATGMNPVDRKLASGREHRAARRPSDSPTLAASARQWACLETTAPQHS
jgi:NADPH:quinone reductase-like Zn-dependent oxidoreductase